MITEPSDTFTDCAQLLDLPIGTALDAWKSSIDRCQPQLCESQSHRPLVPGEWLRPILAGKAVVLFLAKIVWAAPWSLCGLGIGGVGLLTGGGVQRSGRILEFWGGFLPLFLKHCPFVAGSPVATFGHVVLGRSERHLDACRPHQLVHVKQYEFWGPLFVPAYLTWWYVRRYQGKHPYYDNPFERQAFDETR